MKANGEACQMADIMFRDLGLLLYNLHLYCLLSRSFFQFLWNLPAPFLEPLAVTTHAIFQIADTIWSARCLLQSEIFHETIVFS